MKITSKIEDLLKKAGIAKPKGGLLKDNDDPSPMSKKEQEKEAALLALDIHSIMRKSNASQKSKFLAATSMAFTFSFGIIDKEGVDKDTADFVETMPMIFADIVRGLIGDDPPSKEDEKMVGRITSYIEDMVKVMKWKEDQDREEDDE